VNDLFLGLIALGVMVMAIIQVAAIVFAARAARRVGDAVARLEDDVRPIVANLKSMSDDAARATAVAAAQIDRAEKMIGDLSKRLDDTLTLVQNSIVRPAREGFAILQTLKAAFSAFRSERSRDQGRNRPGNAEDEDALFIG
jgi:hypothetical protein